MYISGEVTVNCWVYLNYCRHLVNHFWALHINYAVFFYVWIWIPLDISNLISIKTIFPLHVFFLFFWWRLYLSISEKIWPQKCIQPERIYYFVNHYYESSEICSKYVILCASFFFILKKKELFQYLQKIYKLVCCCFYYFILNDIFKWIVLTELHVILCNF